LFLKLFKVLNVVNIIGDLGASAGHTEFVGRWSRFLLLLVGTSPIVRVFVPRRSLPDGS
jgi:hypothetical protein